MNSGDQGRKGLSSEKDMWWRIHDVEMVRLGEMRGAGNSDVVSTKHWRGNQRSKDFQFHVTDIT